VKVAPRDADAFCRAPPADVAAVLVYGPDRGLVAERGERLAQSVADDLADAFRVAELSPARLAADPAALADEARARSLIGGRRVVRVRGASNEVARACANLLADELGEALVVVEAGELRPASELRKLFEGQRRAAAVPCYLDDPATLEGVIREALAGHGLRATPGALAWLARHLGGDRRLTRAELDKLALYVGDAGEVTEDDAAASVGDSAEITLDHLADAVALGDLPGVHRALVRLALEGTAPVRMLGAMSRHIQLLQFGKALVTAGTRPEAAAKGVRPPLFYKRHAAFADQLRRWTPEALAGALDLLLEAEIDCKTTGRPDRALCGQAAIRLALAARRQGARA
jgi:DNA polymerase-3 subunit delta